MMERQSPRRTHQYQRRKAPCGNKSPTMIVFTLFGAIAMIQFVYRLIQMLHQSEKHYNIIQNFDLDVNILNIAPEAEPSKTTGTASIESIVQFASTATAANVTNEASTSSKTAPSFSNLGSDDDDEPERTNAQLEQQSQPLTNDADSSTKSISNKKDIDDLRNLFNENYHYSEEDYRRELEYWTTPDPNQVTLAFKPLVFYAGFVNQVLAFSAFLMFAQDQNVTQVLLPSLQWKDLFGTNQKRPMEFLFDVVHWNKNYAVPPPQEQNSSLSASSNNESYEIMRALQQNIHPSSSLPYLPRLVRYDAESMPELRQLSSPSNLPLWTSPEYQWKPFNQTHPNIIDARRPWSYGQQPRMFRAYRRYGRQHPNGPRHAADLAILYGALKPHPQLRHVLQQAKYEMRQNVIKHRRHRHDGHHSTSSTAKDHQEKENKKSDNRSESNGGLNQYLCLHARIEPDMQNHITCRERKVVQLRDILDSIYQEFPHHPPRNITHALFVLNRPLLEKEAKAFSKKDMYHDVTQNTTLFDNDKKNQTATTTTTITDAKENWIAYENLQLLNQLRDEGMWNGTVPVYEVGIQYLKSNPVSQATYAKHAPAISGAILDYNLALDAAVFVGTPVSSFSAQVIATRHYRFQRQEQKQQQERPSSAWNYHYLPSGLKFIPSVKESPEFDC